MENWYTDIPAVLGDIPNTKFAYGYPDSWPTFENNEAVITYRLANDIPAVFADDEEYEAEIEVYLDVWAKMPDRLDSVANAVKERLRTIAFVRSFNQDLYETESKLYHRTARYKRSE